MGHKIVFFQKVCGMPFDQKEFCPTYFACVFWSYLAYSLSDIKVKYFQYIYPTNYGLNKLKKHGTKICFFSKRCMARRLTKNNFVRLTLRVHFGLT